MSQAGSGGSVPAGGERWFLHHPQTGAQEGRPGVSGELESLQGVPQPGSERTDGGSAPAQAALTTAGRNRTGQGFWSGSAPQNLRLSLEPEEICIFNGEDLDTETSETSQDPEPSRTAGWFFRQSGEQKMICGMAGDVHY